MAEDWENGGFGLYIHWPFCTAKCPYCDFNSHVARKIDHQAWEAAYLTELRRVSRETKGRVLRSVFFGGGTPSLMEPSVVHNIMLEIQRLWPCANDLETTLEANPSSVEASRFLDFKQAGINRISMGIQALNDLDLRRLGRLHTTNEAIRAFDIARTTFDRVSFDLIYGRQEQTLEMWKSELNQAVNMAIDHLSLYQLTIENGTAFAERYQMGGLKGLPDEDLSADMYEITQEICEKAGMPAYEVSNHARDGAQSRHNLIYWRYGDYIGIGPGAHGRVTLSGNRYATEHISHPLQWLNAVETGNTEKSCEYLRAQDQASEFLLMGLRLREGIDVNRYRRISGHDLNPATIDELQNLQLVTMKNNNISVTNQGFMVLNGILRKLITESSI